jgi:UMF1 family MFS transporter
MNENSKKVVAWILYDFANSSFTTLIVTFIYATYFTKFIAGNEIEGTALWSRAITITALAVAILSPLLGVVADRRGFRKKFLFISTIVAVTGSAMLYTALPGQIHLALFWFIISNIAFEIGSVFYNAYLPDLTTAERIGRISGIGWAAGYAGGLLAMLVAMVGFVSTETPWFGFSKVSGENIRATNLLVAAWYFIFSIPIFIFMPGNRSRNAPVMTGSKKAWLKETASTLREALKYRDMVKFLMAHLIFNDGLITIFAFGGIYAAGTFNFSFEEIMIFGIVLNVMAGLGAYLMGFIDDKMGGKRTVQISLWALSIATIMAVTAPNATVFWIAGILVGVFSGPNQAASRSLMGRFVPSSRQNEFFGFYAFSGKLTAFLGPLFLGLFTDFFKSQRAGVAVVFFFFLIGSLILSWVNESEGIRIAKEG